MIRNANHSAQSRDLLSARSAHPLATNATNLIQHSVQNRKQAMAIYRR